MKSLVLIVLSFWSFNIFAAGEITSTGGEFITTEKNPWFIGEKPVSYCVETSKDFSVSLKEAEVVVAEVLADWTMTIEKLQPSQTFFNLPDGETKNLTLKFNKEKCQDSTELKFLMGVYDGDIETTLKTKARYTAAFAGHRGINDMNGRVESGFIWLVPDMGEKKYVGPQLSAKFWSEWNVLKNVLLHEMGHVFGFRHHDDGIMNDGYPAFTIRTGAIQSSSSELLDHKWPYIDLKACNNGITLPKDVSRTLLKTDLVILWDVCVESKESKEKGVFFTELMLSFTSEEKIVEKKFRFNITSGIGFSNTERRSVMGRYFVNKILGPADYSENQFISFYDTRYVGELEDIETMERFPATISKVGTRIELFYTLDKAGYSADFYLGNLAPTLGSIKEKIDARNKSNPK